VSRFRLLAIRPPPPPPLFPYTTLFRSVLLRVIVVHGGRPAPTGDREARPVEADACHAGVGAPAVDADHELALRPRLVHAGEPSTAPRPTTPTATLPESFHGEGSAADDRHVSATDRAAAGPPGAGCGCARGRGALLVDRADAGRCEAAQPPDPDRGGPRLHADPLGPGHGPDRGLHRRAPRGPGAAGLDPVLVAGARHDLPGERLVASRSLPHRSGHLAGRPDLGRRRIGLGAAAHRDRPP